MRLFNRIEIFGRVTKNPQIREKVTDSGTNYRLVWDIAQYQGKDDTAFWNCVMFGELDYLEKECVKLQKGHMVFVAGQLKKRTNTKKTASGAVIYSDSVIVLVREINDCESKTDTSESNESGSGNGTGATDEDSAAEKDQDGDGFKKAGTVEDEIPEFNTDEETSGTNTVATNAPNLDVSLPDNTNFSIPGDSENKTTESIDESTEKSVSADESQTEENAVDQNVEDGGHSRFEC